jgi:3-oxoacyl-[acyl-carrier-protein] synthase III
MNGAMGFLNACFSAVAMLQTQRYRRAMIVAAEIENNAGLPSAGLRGIHESASAVLLSTSEDGSRVSAASSFATLWSTWIPFGALAQTNGKTYMSFRRKAPLDNHYLTCVEETFHSLLEQEALSPNDLAAVLPRKSLVHSSRRCVRS